VSKASALWAISKGFSNRLCILVALLYAGVGGGIDVEPGFLVEVDD